MITSDNGVRILFPNGQPQQSALPEGNVVLWRGQRQRSDREIRHLNQFPRGRS